MGRIIAVGDIHGHYTKLLDLISKVGHEKNDQWVFLGDFVDYGPQSAEVIEYLIDFRAYRDASFIAGNHDVWFLDWVRGTDASPDWLMYGGIETLSSYFGDDTYDRRAIPKEHSDFLKLLQSPITIPTALDREYVFSHGMLCPTKPIKSRFSEWDALWGRPSSFGYHNLDGGMKRASKKRLAWEPNQYLVFGHTPHEKPTEYENVGLCIDTGAKMDELPLTAVVLPKYPGQDFIYYQSSRLDVDLPEKEQDAEC